MTSIHELPWITRRTPNLLEKHGITTLEQLQSIRQDELLAIRGVGLAVLHDVAQALAKVEAGR